MNCVECDTFNDVTRTEKCFRKAAMIHQLWILSGGLFLDTDEHLELQGLIDDTMSSWGSCMLEE